MKKLLVILAVVGVLVASLIPSVVGAWYSCCEYECGSCCWELCCENFTQWYRVSYFEKVESGFYTPWGTPMYKGVWTVKYVEAHDSEEAAQLLGLRAGYNCFVGCAVGYVE